MTKKEKIACAIRRFYRKHISISERRIEKNFTDMVKFYGSKEGADAYFRKEKVPHGQTGSSIPAGPARDWIAQPD